MDSAPAPVDDLGFDPVRGIATLLVWLIEHDEETRQVWLEFRMAYLAGGQRERDDVIFRLRGTHLQRHGSVSPDNCPQSPCRHEAVCLAIDEISWHRKEEGSDVLVVAAGLHRLGGVLSALEDDFLQDLAARSARLDKVSRAVAKHVRVKPTPWKASSMFATWLLLIKHSAAPMATTAGGLIMSEPVKATLGPTRRGRRGYPLLHAVWQTLAHGGFSPTEIAGLVPDNLRTADEYLIARVRKALPREDQGTFGLWSLPTEGAESTSQGRDAQVPARGGRRRK